MGAAPVEEEGMLTVIVVLVGLLFAEAVSRTVALAALHPEAGPVNVITLPDREIPWGRPCSDRVKSVPTVPPAKASGILSASPDRKPRFSFRTMLAVLPARPFVAAVSGIVSTTVEASSSITVTVAVGDVAKR